MGPRLPTLLRSLRLVAAPSTIGTQLVVPALSEPALDTHTAYALAEAEGDWLCAWCLNKIAIDDDRFKYEGKDHFVFSNPDGIDFHIITFARTVGCSEAGVPTLEHTWFPGHAWSFCQCDQCSQHLGWFYAGQHHFVGLIIDRLVRGQCVRN